MLIPDIQNIRDDDVLTPEAKLTQLWMLLGGDPTLPDLAVLCHAAAKVVRHGNDNMRRQGRCLLDECARRITANLPKSRSRDIACLLSAYAMLHHADLGFLDSLTQEAERKIATFGCYSLASTFWACAKLGYLSPRLLDALAQQVMLHAATFHPQGLASIFWACATLLYSNRPLLDALAKLVTQNLASFDNQALQITLWSCAVLTYRETAFIDLLVDRVRKIRNGNIGDTQIYHAHLGLFGSPPDWMSPLVVRDHSVGRETWMLPYLIQLGYRMRLNVPHHGFQLDLLVGTSGTASGVFNLEFDRRAHYLINVSPPQLRGGEVMRDRIFRTVFDCPVVRVHVDEWNGASDRTALLREKLASYPPG